MYRIQVSFDQGRLLSLFRSFSLSLTLTHSYTSHTTLSFSLSLPLSLSLSHTHSLLSLTFSSILSRGGNLHEEHGAYEVVDEVVG